MSAPLCLCGNGRVRGSRFCGICKHAPCEVRLKRWKKASGAERMDAYVATPHVEPSPEPPEGVNVSPAGAEEWV